MPVPGKIPEVALLRPRSFMRRAGPELPPRRLKEHFGLVSLALVQFCFVLFIYLFIFGCVGSSLLRVGFL